MKSAHVLLTGLVVGVMAAHCGSVCSSSSTLVPGAYGGDPASKSADFPYDTYHLELSADRKTVTEDFTLGGHRYHLEYAVTSITAVN